MVSVSMIKEVLAKELEPEPEPVVEEVIVEEPTLDKDVAKSYMRGMIK